MATAEDGNDSVHAIVGNIPQGYHSSDLRNYFSQFIEKGRFQCFHFRHRPELKKTVRPAESETEKSESVGLGVGLDRGGDASDTLQGPRQMPNVDKTLLVSTCAPSKADSELRLKTTCCVVKLKKPDLSDLVKMYHRKHWLDTEGNSLPRLCFISKIKVTGTDLGQTDDLMSRYKTREEQRQVPKDREEFTKDDLQKLAELHPPPLMPNGNVGTPTRVFLEYIRDCRLPPAVIKKLGLDFPHSRRKRRYGNVHFDYGGETAVGELEDPIVESGKGHEIEAEDPGLQSGSKRSESTLKEKEEVSEKHEDNLEGGSESEEDVDNCEEWERHEALHDDVTNKERNKERLFEEELEIVWEKGGSGLVFYTDAQMWREKDDGDFDEQTADDWDVDMSVYYDPQGGDMDSRDFVKIRQEQRRRRGEEDTDRHSAGIARIGKFEKHTKGIGRRVMEQQGWKDGQGLGADGAGMSDALDNEGQAGRDKSGFGYHGEKLQRYCLPKKRPRADEGIGRITSVFDKHRDTDPAEPLFRRNEPYGLKTRPDGVIFHKASARDGAGTLSLTDGRT